MCGLLIARRGMVGLERFMEATKLVEHRGTRSSTVIEDGCMFYHTRLPIVGLDRLYDQPIGIEDQVVGFVGELLNYMNYTTDEGDTHLAARTLVREGPAGFRKFDGFWALVSYNHRDGSIHLLADYLAQKPIYYRSDHSVVAASSELDALAHLAPTSPDELYLSSVIKWGYCPEAFRTPYAEITRVLQGEHVVLGGPLEVECRFVDAIQPAVGSVYDLKAAIERAVKLRCLSSDVPVACLLSGGLDSSIVYTLAKRHRDVVPFFVKNGEEEVWARKLAGDSLVVVDQDASYYKMIEDENGHSEGAVERALRYMQEPLDLGSLVPQMRLSDAVGERMFRVCLTGDGADEFFGGYGRAKRYDSQSSDVFHELVCYHLPRLDRVMMRNRIEVRSPFLSRRVCELALGLQRHLRVDKKILRDLFRTELPDGFADREKVPLRTLEVERDREGMSRALVETFRRSKWP